MLDVKKRVFIEEGIITQVRCDYNTTCPMLHTYCGVGKRVTVYRVKNILHFSSSINDGRNQCNRNMIDIKFVDKSFEF